MNNNLGFIPRVYPEGQVSCLLAPNYNPKNKLVSIDTLAYFGGLFLLLVPFFNLFFNTAIIFAILTSIFYLVVFGSLLMIQSISAIKTTNLKLDFIAFKMILSILTIDERKNVKLQPFQLAYTN